MPKSDQPRVSVIVPVRNAARTLNRCLDALASSTGVEWELIVVDDGSTDESACMARRYGARVLCTCRPASGPAQARNVGAADAHGALLCFIDADVVVRSDTVAHFAELFDSDPGLTAAFGSYDNRPAAADFFSQYRNLLHHYVHQRGREDASTFWAGCGAIRRHAFLAAGGFDSTYRRPSIEDIELGYRLTASGARVRLAKDIQVTHLKRWSLWSILVTDIRDRALPWSSLIASSGRLPDDLNVGWASRASALSVYAIVALLLFGRTWRSRAIALLPVTSLFVLNGDLYRFVYRNRGGFFLVRAIPMHWFYYAYSSLTFVAGAARARLRRRNRGRGGC